MLWLGQAWWQPQHLLLARLENELAATTSEARYEKLQQIAAFGDDGIPYLVRAIKQGPPPLASDARGILTAELDRWQLLTQAQASRRLAALACALAKDIEQCDDNTRRVCGDFATRVLLWPVDARAIDQSQLITDCEHVLLSVRRPLPSELTPAQLAGAAVVPTPGRRSASGPLTPLDNVLDIPGGNLPLEATGVPALPPEERQAPRILPTDQSPRLSPVVNPDDEPRHLQPAVSAVREMTQEDILVARRSDTIQLVHQLVAIEPHLRDAAEEVLRDRGFGEAHLSVARKFADVRPDVRVRLVEQLASQTVVDAKPWLLRLLEDRDASVRLAAAKVLASSSDPQIARRLREQALHENVPEVKAVLER